MSSPTSTSAPNLLQLTPKEFEAFIQNLFTKMGFDTKLYQASGDGGIDCVAYDPHPITGGKFIVQAKLYTRTVPPTHVRDLWGTVQHEGATKGIMITTSGYGPDSDKSPREATEPHRRQRPPRPVPAIRNPSPDSQPHQKQTHRLMVSLPSARAFGQRALEEPDSLAEPSAS